MNKSTTPALTVNVRATPPSKGGESIMNKLNFDIKICLPLLIVSVKPFSDS